MDAIAAFTDDILMGSQLLLILKPAAQAQVGKTKLFINCFRNPTSTCVTKKRRKDNSGSNQR